MRPCPRSSDGRHHWIVEWSSLRGVTVLRCACGATRYLELEPKERIHA